MNQYSDGSDEGYVTQKELEEVTTYMFSVLVEGNNSRDKNERCRCFEGNRNLTELGEKVAIKISVQYLKDKGRVGWRRLTPCYPCPNEKCEFEEVRGKNSVRLCSYHDERKRFMMMDNGKWIIPNPQAFRRKY